MMLYEAIHIQTNPDRFSDANFKFKEKKCMPKNNSAANVNKLIKNPPDITRTRSFVAGHKLRESKWFSHDETKILCAVLETGFIVERKTEDDTKCFGVTVWNLGYEKSKDPNHIKIYALKEHRGNVRVHPYSLTEFWPEGTSIRINNHSDKTDKPHPEEVIRSQIKFAESNKSKWHNSEHFSYWCRYGPVEVRTKHASESIRGINFGLHAGFAMLRRCRRNSHK